MTIEINKEESRDGLTMNSKESRNVITPLGEQGHSSTLVLFLPGLGESPNQWNILIPLIKNMPVDIAYGAPILPHPAFGHDKPTVTALARLTADELRHGKWKEVVIVAHSVGAFVGLGIARIVPDLVKEVIVVNGGLTSVAKFLDHPLRELAVKPRTCLTALRLFVLVSTPTPQALRNRIVKSKRSSRAILGGLVSDAALATEERRRDLMDNAGTPKVLQALWDNRHHWREFSDYAGEIQTKVLFLVGGQDPMGGEQDARTMVAMLPHAEMRVLPGVGHAAPLETAGTVAEAIREALEEPVPDHLRGIAITGPGPGARCKSATRRSSCSRPPPVPPR